MALQKIRVTSGKVERDLVALDLGGSSNQNDCVAVASDRRIVRHKSHRLCQCLRDQEAIKRILMMACQVFNRRPMLGLDGKE
jgi:hypothetical protein